MMDPKENTDNPYIAPSSNLTDESEEFREWTELTISCAESYCRDLVFGRTLALSIFVFVQVALDTILHGWKVSILDHSQSQTLSLCCLGLLLLTVPGVKLYVYIRRQTSTVNEFVQDKTKELGGIANRPWVVAMLMMLISLVSCLPQDIVRVLGDRADVWSTVGSLSYLVLPIVFPIAYFVVRAVRQKAERSLKQMCEET